MRFIVPSLLLVALALAGSMAAEAAPEAEIKAIDGKFMEAFNKEDIEAVVALYASDAVLMTPDGPEMWCRGHEGIRKAFADFFAGCDSPNLVLHDATYRVAGNLGYGIGLFDLSHKDAKTGELAQIKGRFLSVLEKRTGKWVYVVDHASVPMPPGPEAAAAEQPKAAPAAEEHPTGKKN